MYVLFEDLIVSRASAVREFWFMPRPIRFSVIVLEEKLGF